MEMADDKRLVRSLLVAGVLVSFVSTTCAYDFYVGGRDGWSLTPSQSYSNWAERNRFQVHDNLVFKYKKGEDSVLVVRKADFDSCNATNPIQRLDGGDSAFQFDRSGPFFFISGAPGKCEKGQKLVVVVMAIRDKKPTPPPSPFSPASPPSPSPATSPSPSSASPPSISSDTSSGLSPAPSPTAPSSKSSSAATSSLVRASGVSLVLVVALALHFAFLN